MSNYDSVVIQGRNQQKLSISSTAAKTDVISHGVYDLWSDVDCYITISPSDSPGLTTDTGYILFAFNAVTFSVRDGDKIHAICKSGVSGTLSYHQIGG